MLVNKYVSCKDYAKEKPEVKKSIQKAMTRLAERILTYYQQGVTFNKIFNDDMTKYDKHGEFYTFKAHDIGNTQLRILYACITYKDEIKIVVATYYVKRTNTKEYITHFSRYKNYTAEQILQNAVSM